MSPEDLDRLRTIGLSDRAIHDAVQVIAYFNYITRVADALGVEPEDFIRPWGAPEQEKSAGTNLMASYQALDEY